MLLFRTIDNIQDYEVLYNINTLDDKETDQYYNSTSSSHTSLNAALEASLQNLTATKPGHKVIVFLTAPLSSYTQENTLNSISPKFILNSSNNITNASITDSNVEIQEDMKKKLASWLFILSDPDIGRNQFNGNRTIEDETGYRNIIAYFSDKGRLLKSNLWHLILSFMYRNIILC